MIPQRLWMALSAVCALHQAAPLASHGFQFRLVGQSVQFTEESFDKSNFNSLTITLARKKCEDTMQAKLALVQEATTLSDAQKSELELAGQLDIHRFFYQYATCKRGLTFGSLSREQRQQMVSEAEKSTGVLKARYNAGLHGESSLWDKTMETVLDSDQQQRVLALFRQRQLAIYGNYIEPTIAVIDRKVPLTVDQRTRLNALILAKTDPPQEYGNSNLPLYFVLSRMGEIEDDLADIFSAEEMPVIRKMIDAAETAVRQWENAR